MGTADASKRKAAASSFNHVGSADPFGKLACTAGACWAISRTDVGNSKLKPVPAVAMPRGKVTAAIKNDVDLAELVTSTITPALVPAPTVAVALGAEADEDDSDAADGAGDGAGDGAADGATIGAIDGAAGVLPPPKATTAEVTTKGTGVLALLSAVPGAGTAAADPPEDLVDNNIASLTASPSMA